MVWALLQGTAKRIWSSPGELQTPYDHLFLECLQKEIMRKRHISMSHWNYSTVEKIFVGEPNTVHASGGPIDERVGYESLCQLPLWPGGPQWLDFGVHFQAVCAYKSSQFLQWKNSTDLVGILSLAHLWGFRPYPKGIVCRTAGKFVFPTYSLFLFSDSKDISCTTTTFAAWLFALQASCLSAATSGLSSYGSQSLLRQTGLMQLM